MFAERFESHSCPLGVVRRAQREFSAKLLKLQAWAGPQTGRCQRAESTVRRGKHCRPVLPPPRASRYWPARTEICGRGCRSQALRRMGIRLGAVRPSATSPPTPLRPRSSRAAETAPVPARCARGERGSQNVAVPTSTARAPAIRNSAASSPSRCRPNRPPESSPLSPPGTPCAARSA